MQVSESTWNEFLQAHTDAHFLQTSAWGRVKSQAGWTPVWIVDQQCGAQILFRKLPLGITIGYIPRGPIGDSTPSFWDEVFSLCKHKRAIFLKVEPDLWQEDPPFGLEPVLVEGCKVEPVQPYQTIMLDLNINDEADLLAAMKQKTRYNIHLAEKKGIQIAEWQDVSQFGEMMRVTSRRDGFGVHTTDYYQNVYQEFVPTGQGKLLYASFEGTPLAAVLVVKSGKRAWYLYGASNDLERNRMPAYLLQWRAICWAKEQGCDSYDLWGIPDADPVELEEQFTNRSDGLWGVYRFKRGFGGEIKRSIGAWDIVFSQPLYGLYRWYLNRRRMSDAG